MRNIKLTIAYEGTAYNGFQRQMNGIGIQQILEVRLAKMFGHELKIYGAGRTDTGVHAYGQVVNFMTSGTIPTARIAIGSRSLLPHDIVITEAREVDEKFHAQFAATSKIYIYKIYPHVLPNPFLRNYAWHIWRKLNISAMQEAAQIMIGTHDFSAFRAAGGAAISPVRTIMTADCQFVNEMLELSFWGTGFLYHMVRNLTGTLVDVGLGARTARDFKAILDSRERKKAGITAPAHGLYLKEVKY